MAKKPAKKSKKSDTETEDMPDVETEDMDGDDENGDEEEVDEAEETPPPEQPSPEEQGDGEPAKHPPTGSPTTTVKIKGEGTVPIFVDGAMTRLERGKTIKVTKAQLAALKEAGEKTTDA